MSGTSPVMLVTGGSRGIGAATAQLAAENGYDVCFSYRSRKQDAKAVCRAIEAAGQRALAVQADFSSAADIATLWNKAVSTFGTINVLVNNVGVLEQQKHLVDYDVIRLRRIFNVNVVGTIISCREAVRHMSTRDGGAGGVIVNLSSVAARLGASGEYVDYAASKAAVDVLTKGLAGEVAEQGIRVNAVRPGSIYTDIHADGGEPARVDRVKNGIPMKRGGQPEEIAAAILWLASDASSYVTGSILDVTGGL
ncbi:MAG: SDR family oxidoreductase [Planctomycetaceae bacterium]|nr:SDR family oxidoreductase [Planctomycetaceae bacterium]